jgi:hypothetical protein
MSKTFNVIGIIKGKNDNKCSIKFANDLKKRLTKFQPFTDFDRLDFIEIGDNLTKTEALKFLLNHSNFQSIEDQKLINDKLHQYLEKDNKSEYKLTLSGKSLKADITAEQLLEAIK